MAAPALDVNLEEVRMLVHQIGAREAARRLGLSEDTVKSWSRRHGWIAELTQARPALPASMQKIKAPIAPAPADIAVQAYRERRLKTRLFHSKIALENAEHLAEMPTQQRLADGGQTLMAAVKHAAMADNWETDNSAKVVVCIQALQTDASVSMLLADEPTEEEDVFQ